MMDVLERILVIYHNVLRPASYTDPLFDKSCQELIGYVRFYADSVAFMSELMPLLAIDDLGWGLRDNRDLAPLQRPLVMPLTNILLRVTQANPQELGAFLQTETIDLILQVVDSMDLYLVPIRNHRDSTGTLVPELVYGVTRQLLREFVRLLIDYRPFPPNGYDQLFAQLVPRIHSLTLEIGDNASDMSLDDYLDAYDSDDSEDW
ncbi:hypothetical protein MPSEU_001053000 [Mayamaea pseudoterrestris]|nr:hypothetical protein MPSEU_001053000 [Mayamaea pseudoterrestris]